MDMKLTIVALVIEAVIFGICYYKDRQPADPARPRLFPYRLVMITMVVIFLGTLAHVVSLLTGQTVMPRNKIK
jgi:hypothetical protein